mmetsp:Transcript_45651/g.92145  ORF Transcript_45651/g.92145 Transcript_45651/m.92145 type:complete len:246 (+) Transcript_45651:913-1650(+)
MHHIYKVAAEAVAEDPEKPPPLNPWGPVVVYMDECDRFFEAGGKKVKVDKAGPFRFAKDLLAYKNAFRHVDRVVFIGCTRQPEKADKKKIGGEFSKGKGFFDKFLYMPYPDYPTRLLLWRHFVNRELGSCPTESLRELPHSFDLSTIARITEGFSAGAVERCVKKTLTRKRVARLEKRPLEATEFLNSLALEASRNELQSAADVKVFADFTEMVTGLGERRKMVGDLSNPELAGGDAKKKGKGKK